ncbi:hypothetical protein H7097_01910 [Aeromicrobium sp.]|nr:hypothetical protein [Candidatus Saccharibacteria bacterium]
MKNNRHLLVGFVLAFGILGTTLQFASHAGTAVTSLEVESGAKSGVSTTSGTDMSGGASVKFGTAMAARFAGNVPGRVLLGMAASTSIRPLYNEALGITGTVYERRQFDPGWITAAKMNNMLDDCDANNQYCVISFKVPGTDWAGVAAGNYDADLNIAKSVAQSRAKPFAFAVHHEPQGDGVAADWAAMQEYLVQYLSPVNNKMAFTTIANGFWWGPNHGKTDAYIATYYPQSLLNKMNQYRGVIAADFYDTYPYPNGTYGATDDRTSIKMQSFVDWAKAKGVNSLGVGEFGVSSAPEMTNSWNVIHTNRDMFGYANYFNSLANSVYDWRLIPSNYPIYDTGNPLDQGGSPTSQAILNGFKAALAESVTPM